MTRKEAIKEYKERKIPQGVFAVRSMSTGSVWVGSSRNLEAARNGLWFALRHGGHHERTMQQAWNEQGERAFQFEILETLKEDLPPMAVADLLKEKKEHWATAMNARKLLG